MGGIIMSINMCGGEVMSIEEQLLKQIIKEEKEYFY